MKANPSCGPSAEIEFWDAKKQNLNAIFAQLQSPKVVRALHFLDAAKSTYNAPFAKLCKDVFIAKAEANDNVKFLRPLRTWFDKLEMNSEFEHLSKLFRPILHLVLLVWKGSAYYNTTARIVIILREICNGIVDAAGKYVSGETIFGFIDAEEARKAVEMLRRTILVLGKFKAAFYDYKARAAAEVPENPWKAPNGAFFVRLDTYLERCKDILEVTQTIMQFEKLGKIEVGGTKGNTLTTSVQQIYLDFSDAVQRIRSLPYDLMSLDAPGFADEHCINRLPSAACERLTLSCMRIHSSARSEAP